LCTLTTTANRFRDESAPYDVESLTLAIRMQTMTFFGSVALGERFEIGAAVPLVELTIDGSRINVYRDTAVLQAQGTGSASGIGDIAARAKYTLVSGEYGGVAILGELRLPTGDAQNLLGAGVRAYRFMGIGSVEHGAVGLHVNGGLVRGGISDEIQGSGAASVAVHPRVTVTGEMMIRRIADLHPIVLASAPHPTIAGVDTFRLAAGEGSTTLASAVASIKWNVSGTFVIGGHVLWPLMDRGLTAPLTPALAFEYTF